MTIKVGDRLPAAEFRVMTPEGPAQKTTDELFKGKKVVLFAVPGAFTPGCHKTHLPGFLELTSAIKAKGVADIFVTAVNDVFVMDAWKKASGAEGKIEFLADASGDFAKAIGLSTDIPGIGLGRSRRYSMIVEDGIVTAVNVEVERGVNLSSAETLLAQL